MTAAQAHEEALDSMTASVGTKEGLQGDKAALILQKLASREADRRVQLEQQAASSSATAAPSESSKAFLQQFDVWQQSSQAGLDSLSRQPPQEAELKEQLDRLAAAVSEQEQIANAISTLRQQIDSAKKLHLGKKKFGFSRKPKSQSAQPATNQATQQPPSLPSHHTELSASNVKTQLPTSNSAAPSALQRKGLSNLHEQTITVNADELAGGEYRLTSLTGCTVRLDGPMASLHLRDLNSCTVATGPVSGPTFVYGAQDCCLRLASHQIRIHDAHKCKMYIRARSNPIIEHSDALQFAPYSPHYPGAEQHLQTASLQEDNGLWQQVQDFGWLKQTQSPNWSIMPQTEGAI